MMTSADDFCLENSTIISADDETASQVSSLSDTFLGVVTTASSSRQQQQQSSSYHHSQQQQQHTASSAAAPGQCLLVKPWDRTSRFSDLVREGLDLLKQDAACVIMLYERPSTANKDSTFYNCQVYKFHDYPPTNNSFYKTVIGPCRYSLMNGTVYPTYLAAATPPTGLLEHWEAVIPGFEAPTFCSAIDNNNAQTKVYAYLPCERIWHHVHDPYVHYHLAGKDAIHLMTTKTTKLLQCTKIKRPCIAKTTHAIGGDVKGIFVITSDADEAAFQSYIQQAGNPTFVVTEYVTVARNLSAHFFIHPATNKITWFGANDNVHTTPSTTNTAAAAAAAAEPDGPQQWSSKNMDSYQSIADQKQLQDLLLPFVQDVVRYCRSIGFWGFCGIDVLFDAAGTGYLVDVNPHVTGSLPSLMVLQLFHQKDGYQHGIFRQQGNRITYHGGAHKLLEEVASYNQYNEGRSVVVIFGYYQENEQETKLNIGVYGMTMEECKSALNYFAKAPLNNPNSNNNKAS